MINDDEAWFKLERAASKVFTPSVPIIVDYFFSGRKQQLVQVNDAINQSGRHVIIYGERGVGKTSLANIIVNMFRGNDTIAIRVNSDSSDNYTKLWNKIFGEIKLALRICRPGIENQRIITELNTLSEFNISPNDEIQPDIVRQILTVLSANFNLIIIIDEFDRISQEDVRMALADTIKILYDHPIRATIILVGVADSIHELIKEDQSLKKAIVLVQIPRMSLNDDNEIINKGLNFLGMKVDPDARNYIQTLSQGRPYYIHLLFLHASRSALINKTKTISSYHVEVALDKALEQADQSIKNLYYKATSSSKKNNISRQVLLACALATTDSLRYFAAVDVRQPLSAIMKKTYDIPSYARHLKDFCKDEKGNILQQYGEKHRYRFRLTDPLMQPYIAMKGVKERLIEKTMLFT